MKLPQLAELPPLDLDDETQAIINKLPKRQRECFILHFAYDYKYREIAETLQLTTAIVGRQIQLARTKCIKHPQTDPYSGRSK